MEKPISTQTHPKPNLKSTQNKINSKQNPIENPLKKKNQINPKLKCNNSFKKTCGYAKIDRKFRWTDVNKL